MDLTNITACIFGGNNGVGLELIKLLAKVCKKIFVLGVDSECAQYNELDNVEYICFNSLDQDLKIAVELDILFLESNICNLKKDRFIKLPLQEIINAVLINIQLNMKLLKTLTFEKLVMINSFEAEQEKSIQCGCEGFFNSFIESLEGENSNSMIVYPQKIQIAEQKTSDLAIAAEIIEGLENDSSRVFCPKSEPDSEDYEEPEFVDFNSIFSKFIELVHPDGSKSVIPTPSLDCKVSKVELKTDMTNDKEESAVFEDFPLENNSQVNGNLLETTEQKVSEELISDEE